MTENIISFRKKVKSYLKKENFNIYFSSKSSFPETFSEIYWDDTQNWKEFFAIAKNEGISIIHEEIGIFTKEDEDLFGLLDGETFSKLKVNGEIISDVSFYWKKNNTRYIFSKETLQFEETSKQLFYE